MHHTRPILLPEVLDDDNDDYGGGGGYDDNCFSLFHPNSDNDLIH